MSNYKKATEVLNSRTPIDRSLNASYIIPERNPICEPSYQHESIADLEDIELPGMIYSAYRNSLKG